MECGKDTIEFQHTRAAADEEHHSPYDIIFCVRRICIVPAVSGIGGMSSFRGKFEAGLAARGIGVTHDPADTPDAVLVIAGTRKIIPLLGARRRGVRIVQRLDGINWVHRRRRTGLRHFIRAEYGNLVLSQIRAHLATRILYQSEFTQRWWDHWFGGTTVPFSVVLNGVDLTVYCPQGPVESPSDRVRLLVVEGNLGGGYDMGLESAVGLAEELSQQHGFPMELMVVGKITDSHRAEIERQTHVPIVWMGGVAHERIPAINRSAQLLFSADLNPACPNSVIEALACGLPVVAFDTGGLKELILGDSGRLVPYGGDPWKLEKPDIEGLGEAAAEVLKDRPHFSQQARARAESALGLDKMMDGYLKALLED